MTAAPPRAVRDAVHVFSPAKINWVLTIRRRRPDDFHELDTIFQALNWGDRLTCRARTRPTCTIHCNDPRIPVGSDNLVARAWAMLRAEHPRRVGGVAFGLDKRIPPGAGLGGGSSNAAAALVALNRLFGLGLRRADLEPYAAALGSDCAFFLRGGTARGSGRGELLTPIVNRITPCWLVLVVPDFQASTAEAYRRITPEHYESDRAARKTQRALERGHNEELEKCLRNVFYEVAVKEDLRYKDIIDRMSRESVRRPMLSGSGSAMFGFAEDGRQAWRAARRLAHSYPVAVAVRLSRAGVRVLAGG